MMMRKSQIRHWALVVVPVLVLLVDLYLKHSAFRGGHEVVNAGFSWSVGANLPAWVTMFVSLLVITVIWASRKKISRFPQVVLILCLAGLANLSDRLVYGGVIDYLPVPLLNLRNNLADWLIFGCICALIGELGYEQYRLRTYKK